MKKFTLTDYEFAFLKELNILLQFHIARERIMTNFLTYVAQSRLGYSKLKDGYALQFQVDPTGEDRAIKVEEVKLTED